MQKLQRVVELAEIAEIAEADDPELEDDSMYPLSTKCSWFNILHVGSLSHNRLDRDSTTVNQETH